MAPTRIERFNLIAVAIVAIGLGLVKVAALPEQALLFERIGFRGTALTAFGVAELGAGLLVLSWQTRRLGAALLALMFGLETYALVLGGWAHLVPLAALAIVMAIVASGAKTAR